MLSAISAQIGLNLQYEEITKKITNTSHGTAGCQRKCGGTAICKLRRMIPKSDLTSSLEARMCVAIAYKESFDLENNKLFTCGREFRTVGVGKLVHI